MTLKEFIDKCSSGARFYLNGKQIILNQNTNLENFNVICFDAIAKDIIEVHIIEKN